MSISQISQAVSTYQNTTSNTSAKKTDKKTTDTNTSNVDSYEKSKDNSTDSSKKIYKQDTAVIAQLKSDQERRVNSFKEMVQKMLHKQGQSFTNATDFFAALRNGQIAVDPETAAQAQKDIAEDGYWGVKQTSDRIFSFASALTGGDPAQADKMKEAFIKGYKAATKAWGDELPGICKETYDAVIQKFDDWKNGAQDSEPQE